MKMLSVLLVVAVALSTTGIAQTKDAEQSKILALENVWNLAEQNKDVKALNELIGASLVYIDYDGSIMTKAEFLASVQKPSLHPQQIVNESAVAHVYGDAAVVTGVLSRKGCRKRKNLHAPRAIHRHLGLSKWPLAVRREPIYTDPLTPPLTV